MAGARFTPKGSFGTVYLATDPVTALMEVAGAFVNPHAPMGTLRTPPWTLFAVDGVIDRVLDLTDPAVIDALETSVDELSGNWRFAQELHRRGDGPLPPTQCLGAAARSLGTITGVQYHSAKNPGRGLGLGVFPDRMAPGGISYLEVYDPHGTIEQRLP